MMNGKTEITEPPDTGHKQPYLWQVPGKSVSAQFEIDLVDRLSREVLRGFGAMPRRGVEMGGLLLGSIRNTPGGRVAIVEDFEPVACQYASGPGWVLSDVEQVVFEDALARWAPAEGKRTYAVGFYRSHTREGLGMSAEDQQMYQQYFGDPGAIVLLVKPFATRTSVGAVFIREAGQVKTDASHQEFPFNPQELFQESVAAEGGAHSRSREVPISSPAVKRLPPAASRQDPPKHAFSATPLTPRQGGVPMGTATNSILQDSLTSDQLRFGIPTATRDAGTGRRSKNGWVWIPLSFVFVIVGLLLGMLVSASVGSRLPGPLKQSDPYTLGVSVAKSGEGLLLRWDRSAGALEKAIGGQLVIKDGGAEKVVPLDALQLRNGSVIYRNASDDVIFRLDVHASGSFTLSEQVRHRQ